jgi:hypothetical protein
MFVCIYLINANVIIICYRIEIRDADNTYELATEYGANQESGTYHFGWNSYGDAKSDEKLKVLWKCLEKHTGCTYTSILR